MPIYLPVIFLLLAACQEIHYTADNASTIRLDNGSGRQERGGQDPEIANDANVSAIPGI